MKRTPLLLVGSLAILFQHSALAACFPAILLPPTDKIGCRWDSPTRFCPPEALMDRRPSRRDDCEVESGVRTCAMSWATRLAVPIPTRIDPSTKKDVLGFSPGMTTDELEAKLRSPDCKVAGQTPVVERQCVRADGSLINFDVTDFLKPARVTSLTYVFPSGSPFRDMASQVQEQFRAQSSIIRNGPVDAEWLLAERLVLQLTVNARGDYYTLRLAAADICAADKDAERAARENVNPRPKF